MLQVVKKYILASIKIMITSIRYVLFDGYAIKCYSQEGEDMILCRVFEGKERGFYVDIGAHHPMRFSNTYKFYKMGWQGINIEPNPDSFNLFSRHRPRDINLNCGIAMEKGNLEYYMFDEPALNTFDREVLNNRIENTSYKHLKTIQINVKPLADVLRKYVHDDVKIDFLSIDVEGLDLEVIKSNDWKIFRPSWVLVEQLSLDNVENLDFEIHHYMKSVNYVLFAKTFNTLIYNDKAVLV